MFCADHFFVIAAFQKQLFAKRYRLFYRNAFLFILLIWIERYLIDKNFNIIRFDKFFILLY